MRGGARGAKRRIAKPHLPIVEREETEAYGRYRSRDLCLAYLNALAAGDPDADIDL